MRASIVPGTIPHGRIVLAVAALLAVGEVPDTAPEPMFARGEHELLWADDFNDAPRRPRDADDQRLGRYLAVGASHMHFDPKAGVGKSGALRIDWARAPLGAPCADDSRVLEAWFDPSPELYIQFSVRYTPGFVFDWSKGGRCHGNAKKLFLLWPREGSRFVYISENGALGVGSDHDHPLFSQHAAVRLTPAALADGGWHRITFHLRQGSAPGRADGSIRGWIDGVERWRRDGIVTHNGGGYYLFKLPATFNAGSPRAQSEWVDELRIWRDR